MGSGMGLEMQMDVNENMAVNGKRDGAGDKEKDMDGDVATDGGKNVGRDRDVDMGRDTRGCSFR